MVFQWTAWGMIRLSAFFTSTMLTFFPFACSFTFALNSAKNTPLLSDDCTPITSILTSLSICITSRSNPSLWRHSISNSASLSMIETCTDVAASASTAVAFAATPSTILTFLFSITVTPLLCCSLLELLLVL